MGSRSSKKLDRIIAQQPNPEHGLHSLRRFGLISVLMSQVIVPLWKITAFHSTVPVFLTARAEVPDLRSASGR